MEEIKGCPFCGSVNISHGEISGWSSQHGDYNQSECAECGACGPVAKLNSGEVDYGDIQAIEAWNKRAKD